MAKQYISLDIGATKIAGALILNNKIIKRVKIKTEVKKGKSQILKNITRAIQEVYSPKIKGIGIGIAGQVDQKKGIFISGPNFDKNFKNVNLNKILKNRFKKTVLIDNDANCFTLGEAIYGAGKNYDHVIGLTLGTGVGGGIVINQKIYQGANGSAGEIGHMTVGQNKLVCSCGQKDHLEMYASGTAMKKLYFKLTGQKKSAHFVEELAKKGNPKAKQVFKIMIEAFSVGLADIANIFNPDIIILGGGVSKVTILTLPAIKLFKTKVVYPGLAKTKVVVSKLRNDAALLGTVALFNKSR